MNDQLYYDIAIRLDQDSVARAQAELNRLTEQAQQIATQAQGEALKQTTEALKDFNKVNIDTKRINEGTLQGLADLKDQMDVKKVDLKELAFLEKAQNGLTDEQKQKQEEIKVALKATSAEYNRQQRELADVAKAANVTGNTYDDLVTQNRALMIEMRKVPLDDTTGKLAKMQAQYKGNSDRLKEFDKTVGNNFRNVGNYKDALDGFTGGLAGMKGPVGGATSSLMGFNAVMKANPIMAITQLILGLISILSKLQVATDGMARGMAMLSAAFEYSRDVIGSWLGLNERNNRSMIDTIRLARELKQAEQDLSDTRIAGLAPMARARMEISKLREQLNDENLTNAQRLAIIDQALAKEAQLADAEEYLARERFRIAKEQAALNESDRAAIEEVANAEVDLIAVRENSYNRRRELGEKRKTLALAEAAAERAALTATLKDAEEFVVDLDEVFGRDTTFDQDPQAQARIEQANKTNLALQQAEAQYYATLRNMEIESVRNTGDEITALEMERFDTLAKIREDALRQGITNEDDIKKLQATSMLEFDTKVAKATTAMQIAEIENRNKLIGMAVNGAMNLGKALFGESKAMSIAQAIIDTYQSANVALKSAPPPFNFALAAANVAAGIANVAKIRNTKIGSNSVNASTGSAPSVSTSPTPSFGTVSASIAPVASQAPTIVLTGDLDSEYLAVKVRRGNDAISSRGITVASV